MLFLIILILTFICSYFLPWWMIAVIAFIAAVWVGKKSGRAFLAGFGGVFIAWVILALMKTLPNDNVLATRMAKLIPLNGSWILLLIVTALIGGLVGGMAALSGVLVKKAFRSK